MKLNKKGFTLVELLATIVILALVMTITITVGVNVYQNAKIKSEEVLVGQINKAIENYIALHQTEFEYTNNVKKTGVVKTIKGKSYDKNFPFKELKDNDLISNTDFRSQYTEMSCNLNGIGDNFFQIQYKNDRFDYRYKLECISVENRANSLWVYKGF